MSRSRNKRYYDDSDDMVERIRRAREAFEKKANAFQGPDWPYYDKRIIQGKKTKEEFLAAQAKAEATSATGSTETTAASSQPNTAPENAPVTAADQTSSWWAAQREGPNTSATGETNDQSAKVINRSDDKANS